MKIVYSDQQPPESFTKSIFLAGPTPRSADVVSWRPHALAILEQLEFEGVVFVPEHSRGVPMGDYNAQVEWEKMCLTMADVILFWVPRELNRMPAFTTNVEFGTWIDSRKVFFGAPNGAPKNTYLKWLYKDRGYGEPYTGLETMCNAAVEHLYKCNLWCMRKGAERFIQSDVWAHDEFNRWYTRHQGVGNELRDAKVLFRHDVDGKLHSFVLSAKMYIKAEDRVKDNEFVVFRPRTVSVLAYLPHADFMRTQVLLVKEFRTAVSNQNGYVVELPGGSGPTKMLQQLAAEELAQETGLEVDPKRLRDCNHRQVYATMLGHTAKLYTLELTQSEFDNLAFSATFGVEEDSERTTLLTRSLLELMYMPDVDWTTIGMIWQGLNFELMKRLPEVTF